MELNTEVGTCSAHPSQNFPDVLRGRSAANTFPPLFIFSVWSRPEWLVVEKSQPSGCSCQWTVIFTRPTSRLGIKMEKSECMLIAKSNVSLQQQDGMILCSADTHSGFQDSGSILQESVGMLCIG